MILVVQLAAAGILTMHASWQFDGTGSAIVLHSHYSIWSTFMAILGAVMMK